MSQVIIGFMIGIALYTAAAFLLPIVTKSVVLQLKKIKEAYDKD